MASHKNRFERPIYQYLRYWFSEGTEGQEQNWNAKDQRKGTIS